MRPERRDVFHRDAVMVAEKPDECRVMVDIPANDLGQLLLAEVKDRGLPDGNRIVGVRSSVERAYAPGDAIARKLNWPVAEVRIRRICPDSSANRPSAVSSAE